MKRIRKHKTLRVIWFSGEQEQYKFDTLLFTEDEIKVLRANVEHFSLNLHKIAKYKIIGRHWREAVKGAKQQ